MSDNRRRSARR